MSTLATAILGIAAGIPVGAMLGLLIAAHFTASSVDHTLRALRRELQGLRNDG